jgi:O-methyltransferase
MNSAALLYLDLLKKCLTRVVFETGSIVPAASVNVHSAQELLAHPDLLKHVAAGEIRVSLRGREGRLEAALESPMVLAERSEGRDWPVDAETMVGLKRLENVQRCVTDVLERKVPGDLIETGVWRGGTTIFMRGILAAHGDTGRTVWVADSFAGLPRPDEKNYPQDKGLDFHTHRELAVGVETVKANFARYGLLDQQVRFLVGWFKDTLRAAPIGALAVLRLDGDLYESTMDAITALYDKVSVGGWVIVDDYNDIPACRAAIDDFRGARSIRAELRNVDWSAVCWQKSQ